MSKRNVFEQYLQIKNDFQQELGDAIDEILGENSSNDQREELFISMSNVFNELSMKYMNSFETRTDGENCSNDQQSPSINIYMVPPFQRFQPQPNIMYSQQQYRPNIQSIPAQMPLFQQNQMRPNINTIPTQNPMYQPNPLGPNIQPIFNQQFTPPQNFNFFNQQPFFSQKVSSKKSHSKKHHDKSKKKDKSSHHKSKDENSPSTKKEKGQFEVKTFSPSSSQNINGIVKYLTTKTGGNIHDNGTIEVKSNSFLEEIHHPKMMLDHFSDHKYISGENANSSYIRFDFKNMRVELSHYTIKSCGDGHALMKNWVLEISDDEKKWTQIDRHVDEQINSNIQTFSVRPNRFARYCQLRQNGQFSDSYRRMWLNSIEFYGKLKMPV